MALKFDMSKDDWQRNYLMQLQANEGVSPYKEIGGDIGYAAGLLGKSLATAGEKKLEKWREEGGPRKLRKKFPNWFGKGKFIADIEGYTEALNIYKEARDKGENPIKPKPSDYGITKTGMQRKAKFTPLKGISNLAEVLKPRDIDLQFKKPAIRDIDLQSKGLFNKIDWGKIKKNITPWKKASPPTDIENLPPEASPIPVKNITRPKNLSIRDSLHQSPDTSSLKSQKQNLELNNLRKKLGLPMLPPALQGRSPVGGVILSNPNLKGVTSIPKSPIPMNPMDMPYDQYLQYQQIMRAKEGDSYIPPTLNGLYPNLGDY